MLGDAANKLALAFARLTSKFVVAFLASWNIYSVATGFSNCARRWSDSWYAVPLSAPVFIITVATDSEGGDPRLTDILWLTLIVTVLWTASITSRTSWPPRLLCLGRYRLCATDQVDPKHVIDDSEADMQGEHRDGESREATLLPAGGLKGNGDGC